MASEQQRRKGSFPNVLPKNVKYHMMMDKGFRAPSSDYQGSVLAAHEEKILSASDLFRPETLPKKEKQLPESSDYHTLSLLGRIQRGSDICGLNLPNKTYRIPILSARKAPRYETRQPSFKFDQTTTGLNTAELPYFKSLPPIGSIVPLKNHDPTNSNKSEDSLDDTPALSNLQILCQAGSFPYNSFINQQLKDSENEGAIRMILEQISKVFLDTNIIVGDIDWKRIHQVASIIETKPLTAKIVSTCILNPIFNENGVIQKNMLLDNLAKERAATLIQKIYRGFIVRLQFYSESRRLRAANTLKYYWHRRFLRKITFKKIRDKFEEYHKAYFIIQGALKTNWIQYRYEERTIIQFGQVLKKGALEIENNFGRFYHLLEPGVALILILPYLNEELQKKYLDALDMTGKRNSKRVLFIVPEVAKFWKPNKIKDSFIVVPPVMDLPLMLLNSVKALNKIKGACQKTDRSLLLVDQVGQTEIALSAILNAPIFGPTADASIMLSKRTCIREFLKEAKLPLLPTFSMPRDVTRQTFFSTLLKNSQENPHISKWKVFRNDIDFKSENTFFDEEHGLGIMDVQNELSTKLMDQLEENGIGKPAVLGNRQKPMPLDELLAISSLTDVVFEGYPFCDPKSSEIRKIQVLVVLDPFGNFEIPVSTEILETPQYGIFAKIIPQQAMNWEDIVSTAQKIANVAPTKGIMGQLCVEFLAVKTEDSNITQYFVNGITTKLTPSIIRALSTTVYTNCTINQFNGLLQFEKKETPVRLEHLEKVKFIDMDKARRNFMDKLTPEKTDFHSRVVIYSESPNHVNSYLLHGNTNLGIYYDTWTRKGSILPEFDKTIKESIPLMVVATNYYEGISMFVDVLVKIYNDLTTVAAITKCNFKYVSSRLLSDWIKFHEKEDRVGFRERLSVSTDSTHSFDFKAYISYFFGNGEVEKPTEIPDNDDEESNVNIRILLQYTPLSVIVCKADPSFSEPPPFKAYEPTAKYDDIDALPEVIDPLSKPCHLLNVMELEVKEELLHEKPMVPVEDNWREDQEMREKKYKERFEPLLERIAVVKHTTEETSKKMLFLIDAYHKVGKQARKQVKIAAAMNENNQEEVERLKKHYAQEELKEKQLLAAEKLIREKEEQRKQEILNAEIDVNAAKLKQEMEEKEKQRKLDEEIQRLEMETKAVINRKLENLKKI